MFLIFQTAIIKLKLKNILLKVLKSRIQNPEEEEELFLC